MQGSEKLKDIARLCLNEYSAQYDLRRPMTPGQVKDAGVLLMDLMFSYEEDLRNKQ
ncbi:MAG: hypothetical protein ABL907_21355 [Hyphomicrobium sp.]